MFKTARFKLHNPSRHKRVMLKYALAHYHLTLKQVLETALADPELKAKITTTDPKGRQRINGYAISHLLYTIAPKGWVLTPLRDYLIGDATAMLLSHFKKVEKAKHKSNPPTLPGLKAPTQAETEEAYRIFATTIEFPLKPQQIEKIEKERGTGHPRVAKRLEKVWQNWAASRAAGELLRRIEPPLPRPIEFTRQEFERGFLLARKGNNYYLLVRLFARGSRYWNQTKLDEGFVNWRTRQPIAGRTYPGLILPLELGRDHHEREYLEHGTPQSAKLLMRQTQDRHEEFYAHVAFEFNPAPVIAETILGIDRGAVKIGAATVIDHDGKIVQGKIDLEGAAFSAEMSRWRQRIADAQRKGHQAKRWFRVRGRKADIVVGEYANQVVKIALERRSQIAIEKLDGAAMGRSLTQSQFRKLHDALSYKAERAGLPKPVEVPAARTSQTCVRCGHWEPGNRSKRDAAGRPLQDVFRCQACGYEANADQNASEIIALRALHQRLKGGKFQKFDEFQQWLRQIKGRDSLPPQVASP